MKLIIVSDAWSPQTNGVVTTFKQVLSELRKLGVQVKVVHPNLFKTLPLPGYPEIALVRNPWKLGKHLETLEFDAMHIATEGPLGIAARQWCLRHRQPFTTSLHTKFPEYLHQRARLSLSWGYAFLRWFHKPAASTLVTTQTQRHELGAWGLEHLRVWGRGVDTELFRPRVMPPGLPPKQPDRPILLYVGRVAVEKNLEAFLRLDIPGDKWVVGDGPQRKQLEKRYPSARWLGYQHGATLASYYSAADVFVFPSKTDTFGLVMLESMACGTPVAAYPVTGPVDIVTQGLTGVLHEDLAVAIQGALRIPRQNCRDYARKHGWQAIAERLLYASREAAIIGSGPQAPPPHIAQFGIQTKKSPP